MGIFSIKKQLLKVIKWEDQTHNTIIHKYQYDDRYAIMKGSELIVMPGQAAIFVYRGSIADVYTEGNWKIEDGSVPILTALCNWKYAFENPKDVEIYYVSLKRFTQMKWGTPNPIMMKDKDLGMVRISGNGLYSFHVMKPDLFLKEITSTIHSYKTEDIQDHLKSIVLAQLTDMLGECEIPALNLAANYLELGETCKNQAAAKFREIGLDIDEIIIRSFKLPDEVEKAMDKRSTLGVFSGAMGDYAQYESVQAMRDAAKNEGMGGTFAAAGIGLGMGGMMSQTFANGMNNAGVGSTKVKCAKCGALMNADAKFCPECGTKAGASSSLVCPKCGKPIQEGSKFCPECGAEIKTVCPKCGKEVKPGTKFCPECGAKIK